jgi:hypothetical protein
VRKRDSSKNSAGVSESFHVAEVFVEIAVHSSAVGCRRTRQGLSEDGKSSSECLTMVAALSCVTSEIDPIQLD